jgi:hypothetical protein
MQGDIELFEKILGIVMAWNLGLKVPLLPLGPYSPPQTILLRDLVGCDTPTQQVQI